MSLPPVQVSNSTPPVSGPSPSRVMASMSMDPELGWSMGAGEQAGGLLKQHLSWVQSNTSKSHAAAPVLKKYTGVLLPPT